MLKEAIMAALALFICYGGNWLIGQCMIERPIVVGMVTGLLLGDLKTGIMIGASLEAIFMGAINIGGAISAEPASATVFAATFAIVAGIDSDAALALAIPIGIVSAFISISLGVLFNVFAPVLDRVASKNSQKGLVSLHFGMWGLKYVVLSAIVFIGVLVGVEPMSNFMDSIPDVVMRGFTACGGLLPAVGFSILLRMLWSKELGVFYLLGFICVAYLGLPLIAVAAMGAVIVVVTGLRDKQLVDLEARGVATGGNSLDDEEAFFQ